LISKGIKSREISTFGEIIRFANKDNKEKVKFLKSVLIGSSVGIQGIQELTQLFDLLGKTDLNSEVVFDLTLARGLNYYTGAIIEVISTDVSIGSICGGGRYDNLTGVFGMEGVSGVGVSFGADRIYDIMDSLNLFDKVNPSSTEVLVLNFGDAETKYALKILRILRNMEVNAELYPDQVKLKKQMSYADSKKIPYIIIAGADEIKNNYINIKNMSSGVQITIPLNELNSFVKDKIKPARY
jgi:histidyl-tRNA synthetase